MKKKPLITKIYQQINFKNTLKSNYDEKQENSNRKTRVMILVHIGKKKNQQQNAVSTTFKALIIKFNVEKRMISQTARQQTHNFHPVHKYFAKACTLSSMQLIK